MAKFGIVIAFIHGLMAVGILALLGWLGGLISPGAELPFSVWWGLLFCLPGLAWSLFVSSIENRRW